MPNVFDWYPPSLAAIGVAAALTLVVAVIALLHKAAGVPLNEHRNAECPDGVIDRDDLTPTDFGLSWVEVHAHNRLGAFPAWFVAAEDDGLPRKVAILVHGRGGSRASCIETLQAFKMAGWSTLSISYRGDKGAPYPPDGSDHLGSEEWRDLQAAVELMEMSGAQEICLYGRSAGGQIVGQYLRNATVGLGLVKHVILDDPVLDWRATFLHNRPGWLPTWMGRLIIWVACARIGQRISKSDLAVNPPVHRPRTLIFHSRKDEVVPVEATDRFVGALEKEWPLVLIKTNAHHGLSRTEDPHWYDLLIRTWLGGPPEISETEQRVMRWMRPKEAT